MQLPLGDVLPHLQIFAQRMLPSLLRRLRAWKGLNPHAHRDVLDDLHQELVVDCLEHEAEIATMAPEERHARWFRLVERRHYELRVRGGRRAAPDHALDSLVDPASSPVTPLSFEALVLEATSGAPLACREEPGPAAPAALRSLRRCADLLRCVDVLGNGRLNAEATAQKLGVQPRHLRALWQSTASDLGYGDDFLCFWRRRLAEALTGLAADLLRDRGWLRVCEERRSPPDPCGRLQRLKRIRAVVSIRPLPVDMRRTLARYTGRAWQRRLCPREMLQAAEMLWSDNPAIRLWRFEAEIALRDHHAAASALRAARHFGAEPIAVELARARLLEARGHEGRAARLLRRALARHRGDGRLQAALAAL